MRERGEGLQVGHAVVAGAARERVVERERAQGRPSSGAPPGDHQPVGIGQAAIDQVPGRVDAVDDVHHAPPPVQALAERATVAGAAPVVHVDDREPTAREVLDLQIQPRRRLPGRPPVAPHDQRRARSRRPPEVGVGRRVVVRVGGAALGGERDRLGDGQSGRVEPELLGDPQDVHRAGRHVQRHDLRGLGGRRAHERDPGTARVDGGLEARERQVELEQLRRLRVEHAEVVHALTTPAADDAAVVQEGVRRVPELPQRDPELRRHRREVGLCAVLLRAVQVPPPGAIGDEVEPSVRTPGRLEHGLVRSTGDRMRRSQAPVRLQLRDHHLGPVPGHAREVPLQPHEPAPVRREAGTRVEVPSRRHDPRRRLPVGGHHHELVVREPLARVALPDADDQATVRRHAHIGEPVPTGDRGGGRDRDGVGAWIEPVQPLVGEVGEDHRAPVDRVVTAPVLVDLGADVEAIGGEVDRRGPGVGAHQGGAAALGGPRLMPRDRVAVDGHLGEPEGTDRDALRGDRRAP